VTKERDDVQTHVDPSNNTDGGDCNILEKKPFQRCNTLQGTSQFLYPLI
jgi:hypothetical protein